MEYKTSVAKPNPAPFHLHLLRLPRTLNFKLTFQTNFQDSLAVLTMRPCGTTLLAIPSRLKPLSTSLLFCANKRGRGRDDLVAVDVVDGAKAWTLTVERTAT